MPLVALNSVNDTGTSNIIISCSGSTSVYLIPIPVLVKVCCVPVESSRFA